MKQPGLMIFLCFLCYSPLSVAQNFTSHSKIAASHAIRMTQRFPPATGIMTNHQYFTQPVFLFQRIAPTTTPALSMKQLIKTDDPAFAKKMFFRLAPGKNQSVNFKISPDSSQLKPATGHRK